MSQNLSTIFRQPWFLPLFALVGTIVWLQIGPQKSAEKSFENVNDLLTSDKIKFLVSNELRSQLIDNSVKMSESKKGYPPVINLPETQRLSIVVTGGSGFVGSHLVDRLMMEGHRFEMRKNIIYIFIYA